VIITLRSRCPWRSGKTACFKRHFWHANQADVNSKADKWEKLICAGGPILQLSASSNQVLGTKKRGIGPAVVLLMSAGPAGPNMFVGEKVYIEGNGEGGRVVPQAN